MVMKALNSNSNCHEPIPEYSITKRGEEKGEKERDGLFLKDKDGWEDKKIVLFLM